MTLSATPPPSFVRRHARTLGLAAYTVAVGVAAVAAYVMAA